MPPIQPSEINVIDINTLTVSANLVPATFIALQEAQIVSENAIIAGIDANIATFTAAIASLTNDIADHQASIVGFQTSRDAAVAKVAAHQANIDAVTKVLPSLATISPAQNALPAQSVQVAG